MNSGLAILIRDEVMEHYGNPNSLTISEKTLKELVGEIGFNALVETKIIIPFAKTENGWYYGIRKQEGG